eukprot:3913015-Heterocapsa_arctica.AAC.1
MEDTVRTVRSGLEFNVGMTVRSTDSPIPWLVENVSQTDSRYRCEQNGRTPVERNGGRAVKRPVCEFEERVLYIQWTTGRGGQLDDHSMHSTYLETSRLTGETIIGTDKGALWSRT